jgi:uncharacterized coiled-coil protein SlyX
MRFIVDDAGTLIDMETRDTFDIVEEVCPLLNEQHETIQRLEAQLSHLEYQFTEYRNKLKSLPKNEVKETLQKHYDKSKEYNHIDTERYYIGMGVIKEIAKELGVDDE